MLLLLISGDLSMMEAMGSCGRPFHQRGTEMVLGHGDVVLDRLRRDRTSWRGRAVEPEGQPGGPPVGGDEVRPGRIGFVGSVTWRENASSDRSDLAALASVAALVPGASADTPLLSAWPA